MIRDDELDSDGRVLYSARCDCEGCSHTTPRFYHPEDVLSWATDSFWNYAYRDQRNREGAVFQCERCREYDKEPIEWTEGEDRQ